MLFNDSNWILTLKFFLSRLIGHENHFGFFNITQSLLNFQISNSDLLKRVLAQEPLSVEGIPQSHVELLGRLPIVLQCYADS